MYPSNRMNPSAPPNMQGLLNSGIGPNFNMGNGTNHGSGIFYMNDRMTAGSGNVEHMSAQTVVGSFCPHPAVHVGSEAEHLQPLCGSGAGGLVESNYGRANHFTDVGRRVCKRKNLEDISGHSSYDGPPHSFNWEEGNSSRFTGPIRHDMGSVSSFSASGVTPVRVREWEEPVVPRPGLMVGSGRAVDYRNSALSVTAAMEGAQRSVRSRSNSTRYQEPNLLHLRPSGNHARHFQVRNHSSVDQPANMELAETGASATMHDTCQFPTSSTFQRRNLGGWNENMPRASSHFSSIPIERDRSASLHSATSSSSTVTGVPNQGWYMSGADNRSSNDDLWTPMNRNMSGTTYTAQISGGPVLNSRTAAPWRRSQSLLHMQGAGANSGVAQESLSSLRPGQSNHFSRPPGPFAPPLDMVLNPAAGLQGPHYLRSSLVEHRDQNARPLIRSILDVSFERLQTLQNEHGGHNRIMPEA